MIRWHKRVQFWQRSRKNWDKVEDYSIKIQKQKKRHNVLQVFFLKSSLDTQVQFRQPCRSFSARSQDIFIQSPAMVEQFQFFESEKFHHFFPLDTLNAVFDKTGKNFFDWKFENVAVKVHKREKKYLCQKENSFSSECFSGHVDSNFHYAVEKIPHNYGKNFAPARNLEKNTKLCQRENFPGNMLLWTTEEQFSPYCQNGSTKNPEKLLHKPGKDMIFWKQTFFCEHFPLGTWKFF